MDIKENIDMEKITKKIEWLLDKIDTIKSFNEDDEEFCKWKTDYEIMLSKIYNDKEMLDRFKKIEFKHRYFGVKDEKSKKICLNGLELSKLILFDVIDDLIEVEEKRKNNKISKIFISHSSKDEEYVKELISLLNDIGIDKDSNKIFCSSIHGYDIPNGKNIFDYIKEEYSKDVFVILVLSENYYKSPVCLNEMGATWVTSKEHRAILLPEFKFEQIKGVIDSRKICFNITDSGRLDYFREELREILEINNKNNNNHIWNGDKERFINNIQRIDEIKKLKDKL